MLHPTPRRGEHRTSPPFDTTVIDGAVSRLSTPQIGQHLAPFGSVNLAWPDAGRGSWTRVVLAREMFGALVHDGGLVWSSGVPGSLVGVLVVER